MSGVIGSINSKSRRLDIRRNKDIGGGVIEEEICQGGKEEQETVVISESEREPDKEKEIIEEMKKEQWD